jgi:hypothetical protein
MPQTPLRILLAAPRGFCAGVVRAIDVVERALALHGAPVYVRHEIVHNKYVVDSLKQKGDVADVLQQKPAAVFLNPVNWEGVKGSLLEARRPKPQRPHRWPPRPAGQGVLGH